MEGPSLKLASYTEATLDRLRECLTARNAPWANEEALAFSGGPDVANRDRGPISPKTSSPPEEPDSGILRGYCGGEKTSKPMSMFILGRRPSPREKSLLDRGEEKPLLGHAESPPRHNVAEDGGGNLPPVMNSLSSHEAGKILK